MLLTISYSKSACAITPVSILLLNCCLSVAKVRHSYGYADLECDIVNNI